VRTFLLEGSPIHERDFTGGQATALWSELVGSATVVRSYEELAVEVR